MLEIVDKVVDGIKLVRETAKRLKDAELQNQIADVMLNAATLKVEMAELKTELVASREEVASLKRGADLQSKLRREGNLMYPTEDIPHGKGPFCAICRDTEGVYVAVTKVRNDWWCIKCHRYYT